MRKTARYNIVFMMKPNDVITVFIQRMNFSMKETFYLRNSFMCTLFLNSLCFKKTAFKVNSLDFIIELAGGK